MQRGARTVAVLTSLAEQARTAADRRRIVDAERAPIQREVLLLSLIMGALVMVLLVFGRSSYLDAYDTDEGQLFLGAVLAIVRRPAPAGAAAWRSSRSRAASSPPPAGGHRPAAVAGASR